MKRVGHSPYIEDYFTIVTGIKIFNPLDTISSLVNGNGVYFAEGLCLEDLTDDLTHSSCLKIIAVTIIII